MNEWMNEYDIEQRNYIDKSNDFDKRYNIDTSCQTELNSIYN